MAKDLNITVLYDFYGDILTEKQQDVIDYYYNEDLSLSEISEHLGITRQGVRDSIKRAESVLLDMEDRLGLARRFRSMREGLENIVAEARAIEEDALRGSTVHDITMRAARIEKIAEHLNE